MNHRMFYTPLSLLFMGILTILLVFVTSLLFVGVLRTAFTRIGFSWDDALLLLLVSLIGSSINIPLMTLESKIPVVRETYVRVFGVTYRIPLHQTIHDQTTIAVNVGGAVVPTVVSLYLIYSFPGSLRYAIAATLMVAVLTHAVAKPIKGLGIVTPALVPPAGAALISWLLVSFFAEPYGAPHSFLFITAYVGGTLGTLIGADILNLNRIRDLGASVASIGGAGTFDGVFLTGIIAVLLV